MNTICNIRHEADGAWIITVKSPGGGTFNVLHRGTRREALDAARRAVDE